jgi:hypothetical protein
MDPVTGDFEAYLADFDEAVRDALADLSRRREVELDEPTLHPGETVDAQVNGQFRGRRFEYRRRIWPAQHSGAMQAGLFVTFLEEALLTGRL